MKPTALRLAALFFLVAPLAALQAGDESPIVGAIRWDGWYGDGIVTKAVDASLGPKQANDAPIVGKRNTTTSKPASRTSTRTATAN